MKKIVSGLVVGTILAASVISPASAHRTGSYHWHVWNDHMGCAYQTLYYPSGGSTGITQFLMC